MLAAKRQLNVTQRAINNSMKTLERDGVLAEQAGHPLHAFATDSLKLSGERITRKQVNANGMRNLFQLITTVL